MKVLIASSYLYNPEWDEFTKNKTGFGIMVRDIVDYVAKEAEVCFISHVITCGHGKVVTRHLWRDVFLNASFSDYFGGIVQFFKYRQPLKRRARYAYYRINEGYIRNTIRVFKPDIVHIHGIGQMMVPYIRECKRMGIPFIVTLHGLIGMDYSISAPEWDKKLEKDFLVFANKHAIPVTVISSGMKKRIEDKYLFHKADNITIVCNGTKVSSLSRKPVQLKLNLRNTFKINENEKIIVSIGTICENKNQVQIVRAVATGLITIPFHLFFCGTDFTEGYIKKVINDYGLNNKIHVLGFVSQEIISDILEQSDLNVLASKVEGFGLSIIEAFSHGVPSVAFSDLDSIPDLYSENTMVVESSRTDEALASAIAIGLNKKWEKDIIREHAKTYDLSKTAQKYYKQYLLALESHK